MQALGPIELIATMISLLNSSLTTEVVDEESTFAYHQRQIIERIAYTVPPLPPLIQKCF
jgi:hypothetical protein